MSFSDKEMVANIPCIKFESSEEVATALAKDVSQHLASAIDARGKASLALSGGTTPRRFLTILGSIALDWRSVIVTLIDERWVPPDHPRSNAHLLQETLFKGNATDSTFIPLYEPGIDLDAALPLATNHLTEGGVLPCDVAVLGMGDDGHTASVFPHTTLDIGPERRLAISRPVTVDDPRITLTFESILSARHIFLHVEGSRKIATLEQAMEGTDVHDMPVRAILNQDKTPVTIYCTK